MLRRKHRFSYYSSEDGKDTFERYWVLSWDHEAGLNEAEYYSNLDEAIDRASELEGLGDEEAREAAEAMKRLRDRHVVRV